MRMTQYNLKAKVEKQAGQQSHIGGVPSLPKGQSLPKCGICGCHLTFFFQVLFPDGICCDQYTLSVFACTSCASEDTLIPQMISGELKGATVDPEFLHSYQNNFRFIVFETSMGEPFLNYDQKIKYKTLTLEASEGVVDFGRIGQVPTWVLQDEGPSNEQFDFIIQVAQEYTFETIPDAPAQMEIGLFGSPEPAPLGYYRLFLSNEIYMYNYRSDRTNIYAFTQI